MQTTVITSAPHENTGIHHHTPKTTSNETLNQIANVSNTQEEHSVNIPCSRCSRSFVTQRAKRRSISEYFFPSSSISREKSTPEELTIIEEGKSLILKSDRLRQQNQQYSPFSFSSAPSYGWKTVFGLGLLAGASVSCGAFMWARQQNDLMPGNRCSPSNNSPLSPFSPPVAQSTTESLPSIPDAAQPSRKAEPLTSPICRLIPIQSMRKNPRGDFFKQTKVCDSSTTHYKDCHVKHINADIYQSYCFIYSKATPCERPEDVNKPVVRVVEPPRNIVTGKLGIKQKVKNAQLGSCKQKNSLCIPYPLEENPDTYIQKCYDYQTKSSCLIKLRDYETE